jgi:hydroxymethylpyrimidine pyrophosphatase-like HAD family hydrolase
MFQLSAADVLAVGDGDNDICMLKGAGRSYAFRPKSDAVRVAADHVITGAISDILKTIDSRNVISA